MLPDHTPKFEPRRPSLAEEGFQSSLRLAGQALDSGNKTLALKRYELLYSLMENTLASNSQLRVPVLLALSTLHAEVLHRGECALTFLEECDSVIRRATGFNGAVALEAFLLLRADAEAHQGYLRPALDMYQEARTKLKEKSPPPSVDYHRAIIGEVYCLLSLQEVTRADTIAAEFITTAEALPQRRRALAAHTVWELSAMYFQASRFSQVIELLNTQVFEKIAQRPDFGATPKLPNYPAVEVLSRGNRALMLAESHLELAQFERAIIAADAAVQHPITMQDGDRRLSRVLAFAYVGAGMPERGESILRVRLETLQKSLGYSIGAGLGLASADLAELLLHQGRATEALTLLSPWNKKSAPNLSSSERIVIHLRRAEIAAFLGRPGTARRQLRSAYRLLEDTRYDLNIDSSRILSGFAESMLSSQKAGDAQSGAAALDDLLIRGYPLSGLQSPIPMVRALLVKGYGFMEDDRWEDAETSITHAQKLYEAWFEDRPTKIGIEVYTARGILENDLKRLHKAEHALEVALSMSDRLATTATVEFQAILEYLSEVQMQLKKFNRAELLSKQAECVRQHINDLNDGEIFPG